MYLPVSGILQSFFRSRSSDPREEIASVQSEDHTYERGNIAHRGPCPGLNALANQGYLPRDGKNITPARVEAALMTALHMDRVLAHTLASQLKPLCRDDGTLDLVDMRRHNVVEHDVSFTRLDFRQGDNYTFQPGMFSAILQDAGDGPTTIKTIARTYRRRQKEEKESGAPGLPLRLYFVSLVQAVSFLHTAETGGALSKEVLTEFYTQEKFPDVILGNEKTRRLSGLVGMTAQLMFYLLFKTE
ncbi:Chloroperoxidase [Podospora appendiculata]|uniref:Chloroperoxidase n=1 Tax=Podospora appendiculata TaxID=314037 RepID=A0AAE0X0L4_9PEZI|nr:Chloroperoxidase [Podospora appendiculata]